MKALETAPNQVGDQIWSAASQVATESESPSQLADVELNKVSLLRIPDMAGHSIALPADFANSYLTKTDSNIDEFHDFTV